MKKIWLVSVSLFLMAGALFASDDSDSEEVIEEDLCPLHRAIMDGADMEVIQDLIKQGWDVNEYCDDTQGQGFDGLTPALVAAEQGNLAALQVLYTAGADLNLEENHPTIKETPLMQAIRFNHFNVVAWLLDQRDAQGNFVVNRRKEYVLDGTGITPFHYVIQRLNKYFLISDPERDALPHGNPDKYLPACLKRGENDKLFVREYLYPEAAAYYRLLKRFLEEDPSILNTPDSTGKTPLFKAIENEFNLYLIDTLSVFGANPNIPSPRGVTPLLEAIRKTESSDIFSVPTALLLRGANPNVNDDQGITPLMAAAQKGDLGLVVKLMDYHGARVDQVDRDGKTVFDYIDDYINAQNNEIAQMPDGPEKQKKLKKVKDLRELKGQAQAQEMRLREYPEALAVADKADAYAQQQLLLAKERAFDVADRVDQQLHLAKRTHLDQ